MHCAKASGLAGVEVLDEEATPADVDEEAFATPGPDGLCEHPVASTPTAASAVTVRLARLTSRCGLVRRRVVLISIDTSKAVSSACESVVRGTGLHGLYGGR
jgi:hypothetical protein